MSREGGGDLLVVLIHGGYRFGWRRSRCGSFGLGVEAAHGSYGGLFRVGCGDLLNLGVYVRKVRSRYIGAFRKP